MNWWKREGDWGEEMEKKKLGRTNRGREAGMGGRGGGGREENPSKESGCWTFEIINVIPEESRSARTGWMAE
jgi:hypothetical protein